MAQFLRPDSNVTQSGFTGGFAEIDEVTASDADAAVSGSNKTTETLEVGLSNPSGTPGSGATTVRYRISKTATAGDTVTAAVSVIQGTTVIASDVTRTAPDAYTTYSFTPDLSSVTDWTDLRLRVVKNASGGGGGANRRGLRVSWAEVEAPDAPAAITGTLAATETGADGFSATGSVTSPVTGTLAAQESGADTFTASGGVIVSGSLSVSETGSDSFAASGTVTAGGITGTLAASESGADGFAATGSVVVSGSLTALEAGSDSFTGNGLILLSGALAASEAGADSFLASGTITGEAVSVTGTLAVAEIETDYFLAAAHIDNAHIRARIARTGRGYRGERSVWPAPRFR